MDCFIFFYSRKNQKMAAAFEEQKQLNNIHYDALEHIFDFINLSDLVNVADTCTKLQADAASYFDYRFGKKQINLYLSDDDFGCKIKKDMIDYENRVDVHFKVCLPLFRNFGSKISKLRVRPYSNKLPNVIQQYIYRYCRDTLTDMKNFKFDGRIIKKRFDNVVTVDGGDICLNQEEKLSNIAKWFPNVSNLSASIIFANEKMIACFPHLKHLDLRIRQYYICRGLNLKAVDNFFEMHPQLESVSICCGHFEKTCNSFIYFNDVLNMISKNSIITKLEIYPGGRPYKHSCPTVKKREMIKLAREHPIITELYIRGYRILIDDVAVFLNRMNSLEKFTFWLPESDDDGRDRLETELGDEWNYTLFDYDAKKIELNKKIQ